MKGKGEFLGDRLRNSIHSAPARETSTVSGRHENEGSFLFGSTVCRQMAWDDTGNTPGHKHKRHQTHQSTTIASVHHCLNEADPMMTPS